MYLPLSWKIAWAGIGHLVAHWTIGALLIAACVLIELGGGFIVSYMPLLAKPIQWAQKYVLIFGVGVALVLLGEYIGAKDMAGRCDARAAVVDTAVDGAVRKATTKPSKPGRWETNE